MLNGESIWKKGWKKWFRWYRDKMNLLTNRRTPLKNNPWKLRNFDIGWNHWKKGKTTQEHPTKKLLTSRQDMPMLRYLLKKNFTKKVWYWNQLFCSLLSLFIYQQWSEVLPKFCSVMLTLSIDVNIWQWRVVKTIILYYNMGRHGDIICYLCTKLNYKHHLIFVNFHRYL